MLAAIPPDSLNEIERPVHVYHDVFYNPTPDVATNSSGGTLIHATQAYLNCLATGSTPSPELHAVWVQFYQTFNPVIVYLTRRCGESTEGSADRAQEVWQTIITRLGAFQSDTDHSQFRAWLIVIAQRRLIDWQRKEARRYQPTHWVRPPDDLESTEPDPALVCEREDDKAWVRYLLTQLKRQASPLSYRVLDLRTVEGQSVQKVARSVGLTPAQVRARHHRMLEKLRQLAVENEQVPTVSVSKAKKVFASAQQGVCRDVFLIEGVKHRARSITD